MKGVTLTTFRRHFGADRTKAQLRKISDEQLSLIYRKGYWKATQGDALPGGVDLVAFDSAVNSGPRRAAKWVQGAVGANQDGKIGPKTLEKIAEWGALDVIDGALDRRLAFLQSLNNWSVFGGGWGRRVEETRHEAHQMAGGASDLRRPSVDYVVVRLGSKGAVEEEWIRRLQTGLGGVSDGDFGPKTEAALRKYQRENGLHVDGVAGRQVYRSMGLVS